MTIAPRNTPFFDPTSEAEAKRRRKYAETLQASAKMPDSSEMVSGIVVKRSPLELLAKAVQGGMGAYQERKADEMDAATQQRRQQMWAQALQNPDQAAAILGQDPATAPDAFKMQLESMNDLRDFEQQKEIARINAEAMAPYRQLQAQGLQSQLDKQRMLSEATAALGGGSVPRPPQVQDIVSGAQGIADSGVNIPNASPQNMPATPGQMASAAGKLSLANLTPEQQALIAAENPALYKQLSNQPEEEATVDRAAIAAGLGVPYNPLDTRGLSGTPLANYISRTAQNADKAINSDESRQALDKARGNMTDASRFEQLLKEQDTGGMLMNLPGAKTISGVFDPQISEMTKIQDRLTPQMRIPGSGATSDFDARMFQSALPDVRSPRETNQNVITALKAREQLAEDKQLFMQNYVEANGQLAGAERYWTEYLEANPIFDPTKPEVPTLNQNRKGWQEYFGSAAQKPPMAAAPEVPAQAAPQAPAPGQRLRYNPTTGGFE